MASWQSRYSCLLLAACAASIPYGCRFNIWLLRLQFTSLLMPLEKQKLAEVLGLLHPRGNLKKASGS